MNIYIHTYIQSNCKGKLDWDNNEIGKMRHAISDAYLELSTHHYGVLPVVLVQE